MNEALTAEPVQEMPTIPAYTNENIAAPAKVGLNEAARLTGASKTTILKYAEESKLSFELNPQGKKVYQVAELERVFGRLKTPTSSEEGQQDHSEPPEIPPQTALEMALLKAEVRRLEDQNHLLAKNAEDWQQQAERLTLMLTHRPEPEPVPAPTTQSTPEPPKGFLQRLFGR
ncbi:MAG: hypothetical protein JOZ57_15150 [Abitibacteriaceae bacterium]|nr:hypothetical protein [Abditibacteriaceae bacterium]